MTEEEPVILTARNVGMSNSFNPIQISAWHANVDMQFIVSRHKVVQYCTKYVTKMNQGHGLLRILLPTSPILSRKVIEKSKLSRSSSLTQLERGTIRHRKPVTYCYNSPCTKHQGVSSPSVWMAQELFKPMYKRERERQLILCCITIHHVLLLHSSILSLT